VLLGAIAGAAGAVAVSRVLASLLFEVSARDPRVIAIAAVAVGCSGLGASLMAARRGLLLNPASALREE
jgi:ABC-type lipoprotein release transport system permease subunit